MTDALFLLNCDTDDTPLNSDEIREGWKITLPKKIYRHAIQSMRLQQGDNLMLSDGNGLLIHAQVCDVEQGVVEVKSFDLQSKPQIQLCLIQALAKNGHDEQAVDVSTQIGVDTVIPWQADRSIAKWKQGKTFQKWDQVIQAATEQSRRCFKPELQEYITSKQLLALCKRASVHGELVIVLHQDANTTWNSIEDNIAKIVDKSLQDGKTRTIYIVIGPEGGISDQEIESFSKAGALTCLVGSNILRASTAGPVALTLLSRVLGRFDE